MNYFEPINGKYVSCPYPTRERAVPKPIGGLMDNRFVYVPACRTNVAATIERVRRELASGERKL